MDHNSLYAARTYIWLVHFFSETRILSPYQRGRLVILLFLCLKPTTSHCLPLCFETQTWSRICFFFFFSSKIKHHAPIFRYEIGLFTKKKKRSASFHPLQVINKSSNYSLMSHHCAEEAKLGQININLHREGVPFGLKRGSFYKSNCWNLYAAARRENFILNTTNACMQILLPNALLSDEEDAVLMMFEALFWRFFWWSSEQGSRAANGWNWESNLQPLWTAEFFKRWFRSLTFFFFCQFL